MISRVDWRRGGFNDSAVLAAIPTGNAPGRGVVGVPSQDRLNDRHNVIDILEAVEEVDGLAIVVGRRRGHVPFRIDLTKSGTRSDARIFNPGMADVGLSNCPLIPDYLFSVGSVMRIGAYMDAFGVSIRALNEFFILPQNISLRQVRDAAGIEVSEWRDDIICWNGCWALWSSGG